jgi:hypothetical protein
MTEEGFSYGACTHCGCALNECECKERNRPVNTYWEKIDRFLLVIIRTKHTHKCFDCLGPNNSYTVHDHLWDDAWPHHEEHKSAMLVRASDHRMPHNMVHQYLCLSCLEKRLGRRLKIEDFDDAPINNAIRFAYQLGRESRG